MSYKTRGREAYINAVKNARTNRGERARDFVRPYTIVMLKFIEYIDVTNTFIFEDCASNKYELFGSLIEKHEDFYFYNKIRLRPSPSDIKPKPITETAMAFKILNVSLNKNLHISERRESETYRMDLEKWNKAYKFNLKAKILGLGYLEFINNKLVYYGIPNTNKALVPAQAEDVCIHTFAGNSQLQEVNYKSNAKIPSDFATMSGLETIEITGKPKEIGSKAFYECGNLKEINIPSSVIKIKPLAFYRCENLERIKFNGVVKFIGTSAFARCPKLKELILPNGIEKLPELLVDGCTSLKHLWIPKSVKSIDDTSIFTDFSSSRRPYGYGIGRSRGSIAVDLTIDAPKHLKTRIDELLKMSGKTNITVKYY